MTPARTICLGFAAVITVGAFLLMLPMSTSSGQWSDPITALFTATSAVCVTGLSVVDVGTYYSIWGQGLLLLLVQVGGLGYMTATTFLTILIGRRFSLRDKLALQQALDTPGLRGVSQLVKSIVTTTLVFELGGVVALFPTFARDFGPLPGLWQALFHSVSSFNNAGFSLLPANLVAYVESVPVNLAVTLLVVCGGIGYQAIFEGFMWLRSRLRRDPVRLKLSLNFKVALSTTLVLLLGGTLFFWVVEGGNAHTLQPLSPAGRLLAAWFQSVTTRTAGFNTIDIGKMTTTGLFLTIALMFIGASPGGTGGGIKTTTLRLLGSCTSATLQGREQIFMYGRQVPDSLIFKAVGVAVGSLTTVLCSTTLLSALEPGLNFIQILFEATSAFGTVGLSMGITASLSPLGRLVIIATMYVGRVGILLLMAAIFRERPPSMVRYPEETLLVG